MIKESKQAGQPLCQPFHLGDANPGAASPLTQPGHAGGDAAREGQRNPHGRIARGRRRGQAGKPRRALQEPTEELVARRHGEQGARQPRATHVGSGGKKWPWMLPAENLLLRALGKPQTSFQGSVFSYKHSDWLSWVGTGAPCSFPTPSPAQRWFRVVHASWKKIVLGKASPGPGLPVHFPSSHLNQFIQVQAGESFTGVLLPSEIEVLASFFFLISFSSSLSSSDNIFSKNNWWEPE